MGRATQYFGNRAVLSGKPGAVMESYFKAVEDEILKAERKVRMKAARHIASAMRKNLGHIGRSLPGNFPGKKSGNLQKGIKVPNNDKKYGDHVSIVGSTAPHTHLLEFGHGDGKNQNKRPFFRRTFEEEAERAKQIMSEVWVK